MHYKQTGKQINIPLDEMVNYTIEKLEQYDREMNMNHSIPRDSPYDSPVIYKTKQGKYVEIPKHVQEQAIMKFKEMKTTGHVNYQNGDVLNGELIQELPISENRVYQRYQRPLNTNVPRNMPRNMNMPRNTQKDVYVVENDTSDSVKILFGILLILVIIFAIIKYKK